MSRIVGIDLGTTNCCVAVIDGFKPHVIPNKHGYNTTPSVLAVTEDGSRVVGQIAVRQAITNPENTVYGAKRLMGRIWGSEEVEHARQHSSFDIREGPRGDLRILLAGREHSVPELSAMFLQEMRVVAEDFLGEAVDRAVVTVPAYFNDNQRQAVRDAGRIAGLDVVRILNEPTAAALAYGFGKTEPKTLAVYDLGGGTFDISIVRIDEAGEFHVVSTTGDSFLGGEDFDERLMDFLMAAFERDHGVNLRDAAISLQRVRQAAQKAKADLSSLDRVDLNLPFIVSSGPDGPLHLEYEVTREQLEQLTADLVTRTLQICEVGLQYAQMAPSDVDEVVLVGGMTRMPAIQRAVAGYFEREPCKGVHPDEVVALGAAIQGAALVDESHDMVLLDVTPHTLGIMVVGGYFEELIPQNSTVPTSRSKIFTTVRENQTAVKILVMQGESRRADENELLGEFILTGLRRAQAGQVEVEVTFEINADGIVSVHAKDLETGKAQSITVTSTSGLTQDELEDMMNDARDYAVTRRADEEHEKAKQEAETLIAEIEKLFPKVEEVVAGSDFGRDAIEKARAVVERAQQLMEQGDTQALKEQIDALARTQRMFKGVVGKIA